MPLRPEVGQAPIGYSPCGELVQDRKARHPCQPQLRMDDGSLGVGLARKANDNGRTWRVLRANWLCAKVTAFS